MVFFNFNFKGGNAGYAPLGGYGDGDGMMVDKSVFAVGSGCGDVRGEAPQNLGRTLTHEMGHYLNLDHLWGNGGCNWAFLLIATKMYDRKHVVMNFCSLMNYRTNCITIIYWREKFVIYILARQKEILTFVIPKYLTSLPYHTISPISSITKQ